MKPGIARRERTEEELEKLLREADVANQRLEIRADMKSCDEEEDSVVIEQRLVESQRRPRHISDAPPKVKALTRVLELLPPFGRVIVVLALIGAAVLLILRGFVKI